jgi:TatD DNase family protein
MIKFSDSHCHLDFKAFDHTRTQLLADCYRAGIHRIIIPSIGPDNWQQVLALDNSANSAKSHLPPIQQTCRLYACLGIHPWFLTKLTQEHLSDLSRLVEQHKHQIVAIGETGIDTLIAKKYNNLAQQQTFFNHQLMLAKQYNLPIIVHHRQSHHYILPMLKQAKLPNGGIIHAFSGSVEQAKAYVDLGFSLGIGGTISYARAVKTIKAVRTIPLAHLVLETDAPSMPLSGFQGQDNSPLQLIKVFNCLVKLRSESAADMASQLEHNVQRIFTLGDA